MGDNSRNSFTSISANEDVYRLIYLRGKRTLQVLFIFQIKHLKHVRCTCPTTGFTCYGKVYWPCMCLPHILYAFGKYLVDDWALPFNDIVQCLLPIIYIVPMYATALYTDYGHPSICSHRGLQSFFQFLRWPLKILPRYYKHSFCFFSLNWSAWQKNRYVILFSTRMFLEN